MTFLTKQIIIIIFNIVFFYSPYIGIVNAKKNVHENINYKLSNNYIDTRIIE